MGKKILLIDDESDFNDLTSTMLSFHDFEVEAHSDPTTIVDSLDTKDFDLIVTDLMMPGIDGFHLIERLRSKPKHQNTPIIALSAKVLSDQERKYLLQHNVHFLTKPFEPQGLVDQIKQMLG